MDLDEFDDDVEEIGVLFQQASDLSQSLNVTVNNIGTISSDLNNEPMSKTEQTFKLKLGREGSKLFADFTQGVKNLDELFKEKASKEQNDLKKTDAKPYLKILESAKELNRMTSVFQNNYDNLASITQTLNEERQARKSSEAAKADSMLSFVFKDFCEQDVATSSPINKSRNNVFQ